jgi:hypothetical protein
MNDEYRIALFGPKNSGKTVYLTTVYSHGGNADDSVSAHILASDDASDGTHDYLTGAYRRLCDGDWPEATAFEQLRAIRFIITSEGVQSRVNIPDVAGEVTVRRRHVETGIQPEQALKAQILSEFSTFDGFLIFAPADDTVVGRYLDFKWEVDGLLAALKERAAEDGMVRRPIAVVISKWDVVGQQEACDDECASAARFFRNTYPETATALDETCENWKVFPVSSTGPTVNGRPPEKLQPRGVAAPLLWLVRSADESGLRRAAEFYTRHSHELFRRTGKTSGSTFIEDLMSRYESILAKSPPEVIRERAHLELALLKNVIGKRRLKWTSLFVGILLATGISAFAFRDYSEYRQARLALEIKAGEPNVAITRARSFADNPWHLIAGAIGWKKELLATANTLESEWESAWAKRLLRPNAAESVESLKSRIAECSRFIHRFAGSSFQESVEDMQRNTTLTLNTLQGTQDAQRLLELNQQTLNSEQLEQWVDDARSFLANGDFLPAANREEVVSASVRRETELADRRAERGWKEFNEDYAQLADKPWDQYLTSSKWIAQNPESVHADEASIKMAVALAAADNVAWNQVQEYKQSHPTDYRKILAKTNEYLTKTEFILHRSEADEFRAAQITKWDDQMYRDIVDETAGKELTGDQLRKIYQRCKSYVEQTERPVAMRKNVEAWIKWYEDLQNEVTVVVDLESVIVKRGARWHGSAYYPDVFVEVKFGSRSGKSGEKELDIGVETANFPNSRLGTFPWKLGDRAIEVSITCTDFSEETLTAKLAEDEFMLRHLNSVIKFDNGNIQVRLKCAAAVPPTLPSYTGVR